MRIEFEYDGYNPRQCGMPWGAIVKFEGGKLVWDFSAGTFAGYSIKGGKLCIECQPGDTIAIGQDFRDREGHIHHEGTLYTVQEDGSLKQVAKVTALEYSEGRQETEPLLAKYSTEELIAELCRRGYTVTK